MRSNKRKSPTAPKATRRTFVKTHESISLKPENLKTLYGIPCKKKVSEPPSVFFSGAKYSKLKKFSFP
jgi:hypothetical protein